MVKQDNIQEERYLVRKAIGSLLFLFNKTRPDMSYGVNVCSRYTDKSADKLIINVKRIFRYVQGTRDAGVPYNMNEPDDELVAFSDSDYAGDFETRRSMIGFLIMCRGGPISQCSRRQSTVASSTTEAEYIAASECCKKLMYL